MGFFDKLKGFFGSTACLAAGFALYVNFENIGDEIPFHKGLGIAFMAFGGVFFLALFTGGGLQRRMRSLLLAMVGLVFAGGALWIVGPIARDASALAERGELVDATVIRSPMKWQAKSGGYSTTVRWSGGRATLKLKTHYTRGSTVRMRVLRDRPDAAVPASAGATTWEILTSHHGTGGTIALVVIGLFAALTIPFNLWWFLAGSPPDPAATQ